MSTLFILPKLDSDPSVRFIPLFPMLVDKQTTEQPVQFIGLRVAGSQGFAVLRYVSEFLF